MKNAVASWEYIVLLEGILFSCSYFQSNCLGGPGPSMPHNYELS